MKILYLHQHFNAPTGTGAIRSYQIARRLVLQGHEVTLISGKNVRGGFDLPEKISSYARKGYIDGIEVISLDIEYSNSTSYIRRIWLFLKYAFFSTRLVLTREADLVYATSTPLTVAIPAIIGRAIGRKKFVFEVRDLWPELPRAMGVITNPLVLWAMSILEWLAYRMSSHVVALSPGIKRGVIRRGMAEKDVTLAPNGCDLDIFGTADKGWAPDGIDDSDFVAVFAGAHGKANGLDAVIDAAAKLQERGTDNIKLLLVGEGMEKERLQQRALSLGLRNVVFHPPVTKSTVAKLLRRADMGMQVLANVREFYYGTSPNKFFDYLAAGLPVITNYPGWVADLVQENNCGLAVPPEDASAFAQALEKASKNKVALDVMARNARDLAIREFNRDDITVKIVSLISRLGSDQDAA